MSKTIKIVGIVIASILAVGIVIIGGYKIMQKVEYDQMVRVVKSEEVKKIIEDDLKEMDQFALTDKGKIQSYQINEKSIKHNPMGGINFTIHINKNQELEIEYTIDKNSNTGKLEYSSGAYSPKLDDLIEREKSHE
ncbi:DUF1310 family protein [Streptococcus macacae]|uniref:PF07006 family protein n=1 Tax=Streptococcus macacae NCTC 11558 TaxID=764298 RepID=G5JV91_9STRE|nr:DUF1310 family protein [Streptococcus macacae]EHJ53139.1 hypothetical protein STRMA_1803 [Streptococcus macacae NCTC 11558]SUN77717.1 membrane protein [Streptococcus macacae NCTC 11558]